jgi:hypothetical protein
MQLLEHVDENAMNITATIGISFNETLIGLYSLRVGVGVGTPTHQRVGLG